MAVNGQPKPVVHTDPANPAPSEWYEEIVGLVDEHFPVFIIFPHFFCPYGLLHMGPQNLQWDGSPTFPEVAAMHDTDFGDRYALSYFGIPKYAVTSTLEVLFRHFFGAETKTVIAQQPKRTGFDVHGVPLIHPRIEQMIARMDDSLHRRDALLPGTSGFAREVEVESQMATFTEVAYYASLTVEHALKVIYSVTNGKRPPNTHQVADLWVDLDSDTRSILMSYLHESPFLRYAHPMSPNEDPMGTPKPTEPMVTEYLDQIGTEYLRTKYFGFERPHDPYFLSPGATIRIAIAASFTIMSLTAIGKVTSGTSDFDTVA